MIAIAEPRSIRNVTGNDALVAVALLAVEPSVALTIEVKELLLVG